MIKPWITAKLNDILGMEDDVVVEYVFTQLEEKDLNPKKMQINLTGFLNARRAREFMGELWALFVEAQNSPEGIPTSLVEKKVKELKIANASKPTEQTFAKATEIDWAHRYTSLTGGRYGKIEPRYEAKNEELPAANSRNEEVIERRRPAVREQDDRDERAERRMKHEEQKFKERKDLLREKHNDDRDGGSGRHRHGRARSHSFDASPAPVRRFTEGAAKNAVSSSRTHEKKNNNGDEKEHKKKSSKKSRKRHHSGSGSDSDEKHAKKAKKHKKDKKSKKHRERD